MSIKLKFFIFNDIFLLNLLIAMLIIIKPIYSTDIPPIDGSIQLTNITIENITEIVLGTKSPIQIQQQQYSDLEEFREINRFNEMYNDFPRISYDTIHQILRDEDSGNGDSIYRRDEKRYQRRWEKSTSTTSTTTTINPIDTIVLSQGSENLSHKKISHTRVKRNSIADNLDLTTPELYNSNNNNINNNSDKYINNSRINSTKILDLTNSNLTTISELNLLTNHSNYEKIHILNLTNNNLLEFNYTNLIINLNELQILDLTQNHLSEFILNGNQLESMKILNLTGNRVQKISSTIIQLPLNNKNNITKPIKFKLKELLLRNNCIKSINSLNLTIFNDLEILDLSCNQIHKLNENFLNKLKNIKYLNLSRNRLGDGKIVLTYAENKTNHKIDDEKIVRSTFLLNHKNFNSSNSSTTHKNEPITIFKEPFYNLLNIDTLILSYNNIRYIDFETFMTLPNLQYLDLSHNMIQGESIKSLQGIPDLVGLSIAYNPDLGDSLQEFVASWSLKELDASGTGLCRIPAALAQSVRTLKLMDNWLSIINCGDLDSYPLLQYLDLSHSHIDDIEEDALGRLEMLETLFLDHNNLKRIPISLPTSLINLFLHQNQITDIQPQYFQGLHNLKTLDLSYNKLLYLPGLPLPKLLTLNLQSSELKRLSQSVVKTSPKLRDLLLDNNPIKCSDLFGIAEWTSSCHGEENYDENHQNIQIAKDIKKYFQKKFINFRNFDENTINMNYENCCCLNCNKNEMENLKQIIPKCFVAAAVNIQKNIQNLQLQTNETMTTTTTNDAKKLDNIQDKPVNLSTNSHTNRPITEENLGQMDQNNKKITQNEIDIIKLNSTTTATTILPNEYSSSYAVDSTVNTQENIIKGYKENLQFSTTIVNKFSENEGNSLNKINEKMNIIPLTKLKSFSSILGYTDGMIPTTKNPTIEHIFNKNKQQMNIINEKKNVENNLEEMNANKILPILSLSLNNSTFDILEKSISKFNNSTEINSTENILKQDNNNSGIQQQQQQNRLQIISDNSNYVTEATVHVLVSQKTNPHHKTDENLKKNTKKKSMTLGEINKTNLTYIIENLPTTMTTTIIKNENFENLLLNKTIINENNNTENLFNNEQKYVNQSQEINKNRENITMDLNKIRDRRLYASKLLKDKKNFSIISNPLNHTQLTDSIRKDENSPSNNNSNMKYPILTVTTAPLPLNRIDKIENENSMKNLQQQQHILDEINRLEIKRRKIYKNNSNKQMRRNEKTNIKKSKFIELTTSATTTTTRNFMNWSIVNDKKSNLSSITTTESTIILASNKLKNKQVNKKADKVIFSNNDQNHDNIMMTYTDVTANENVIIKVNQKNSSTMDQQEQQKSANQQKIYEKNLLKFFTTTSKSKPPQQQLHQIPPILLQGNLLYQKKNQLENNKKQSSIEDENQSIVKDLNIEIVDPLSSSTSASTKLGEQLIQSNNQLNRNFQNSNLSTENIVLHKSINLDKHEEFRINVTKNSLIGNNRNGYNNNTKMNNKIHIDIDHNENSNIKGSNKMMEMFTKLNKRDDINSDIRERDSNKNHLDNTIKVIEIENLMSDQKDELTNDNFDDKRTSSANSYHHYSNDDDNDSKIFNENLQNSFNEFKKDTTEFIKFEHQQHFANLNQTNDEKSISLTEHDIGKQIKMTTKINIPQVKNEFSNYANNNDKILTLSSHLKVNTEIVHQQHQQQEVVNNPLEIELDIFNNHKSNNSINSTSSNNNNTKIISALENIRQYSNNDTNNNKINISKNTHHKSIGITGGNDIDNNSNGLTPEQWLEIRLNNQTTAIGHPGLVIVIGITFTLIFLLGIIHIYRCHRKPWYYANHSNRQHQQHHNFNDKNYGTNDYRCCRRRHQYHFNENYKCNCNNDYRNSQKNQNNLNTDNQSYCCQCNNDDINDYYIEMADKNLEKSLSKSNTTSIPTNRKNIFPIELLRLPTTTATTATTALSTLSSQIDNNDDNYNSGASNLRTSHFGGNNFTDGKSDRIISGRKQW